MDKVAFWDKTAAKYAASPIRDEESYAYKLKATQAHFEPHHQVVEIGCGTGSTALAHAAHVAHIDGVDISPNMVSIARSKADTAGVTNVRFVAAPIDEFVPSAPYDVALAMNILHLVDDLDEVLAQVAQWLQPDGLLISSTVCMRSGWFPLLRPLLPVARWLRLAPAVAFLSRADLHAAYAEAGFTVIEEWQHWKGRVCFLVGRRTGSIGEGIAVEEVVPGEPEGQVPGQP
ncbi:MAG: class I SAM-dependent methyltransferase [Pseudomonadota bacterium]